VSNSKKYSGFTRKGLNNLNIISDYGNVTLTKTNNLKTKVWKNQFNYLSVA
jgi:hypothetical protein